ncbi:MAG TPA: aminopeptidase, partial [Chloroflexi bacterium]|nr:aminopeptidase [Chloroflexota bacterium]
MDIETMLVELMAIPGPTGRETAVMDWLRERWAGKCERVWETKVGNLLAHVGGSGPALLIQGHADELSFVVRSIDERGFLWLSNGQAPSTNVTHRFPVGQPALVIGRGGRIEGLFAAASGHILTARQREHERVDLDDLFVDIGASSREEALALGAHVGASVVWNPPARR